MTDISQFNYHLPESLIAQRPAPKRDDSRLMRLERATGAVSHHRFAGLPGLLRPGDTLVVNDTKVFWARLRAKRHSGGAVELLLVRDLGGGAWEAMIRGLARLRPGEQMAVGAGAVTLVEKLEGGFGRVAFASPQEAARIIETSGEVPLPPYIHRPGGAVDTEDRVRYQTVFAREPGSCAAPTAGLHFTETLLETIRARGVEVASVTLHVGPGTFKPVTAEQAEDHVMDAEPYLVDEAAARAVNRAKDEGRRVVAVGTTVTRTLESAADERGRLRPGAGETRLFITPGYTFRAVDAMVTNFHLPRSTLLMLVCAFAGRDAVMRAYEEAVREGYRFYSYGDAMLIE